MDNKVVLKFDNVDFEYVEKRPVMTEACFSVRNGSKITLMGQNGAGKSTIFKLITGELKPKAGKINIDKELTIGIAKQVIDKKDLELTTIPGKKNQEFSNHLQKLLSFISGTGEDDDANSKKITIPALSQILKTFLKGRSGYWEGTNFANISFLKNNYLTEITNAIAKEDTHKVIIFAVHEIAHPLLELY